MKTPTSWQNRSHKPSDENWSLMVLIVRVIAIATICAQGLDLLIPGNLVVKLTGLPSGAVTSALAALTLCIIAIIRVR
jgi:hypothetical protein